MLAKSSVPGDVAALALDPVNKDENTLAGQTQESGLEETGEAPIFFPTSSPAFSQGSGRAQNGQCQLRRPTEGMLSPLGPTQPFWIPHHGLWSQKHNRRA
eukprot:scaffold1867_cov247-Pinguiococcus_pyrenoidosus.AAC.8